MSEVHGSKDDALSKALEKAALIAGKSPVAVVGTKHLVDWSIGRGRGGRVEEALGYTAGESFVSFCVGAKCVE